MVWLKSDDNLGCKQFIIFMNKAIVVPILM